MQWTEKEENAITVLTLTGEIDLQHSPELRKVLQEKIKKSCHALVIDFGGVEYIDSSGLATLVEYRRDSRKYKGELALINLTTRVRTIFDLVRLNEIISIYPTLAEAATALQTKS
ncbi:MAG: STAS domain-containing protein [Chthoniobacteraceae bacterium]